MSVLDLRKRLENLRTLWLLVDDEGAARVAVPLDRDAPNIERMEREQPVETALPHLVSTLSSSQEWDILVSARRGTDAPDRARRSLPPSGRELAPEEYAVLGELGMDVPFGEWASSASAVIFLIPGEG